MDFLFTPEEARPTAVAVSRLLVRKRMTVQVEVAVSGDAPYKTTLLATRSGFSIFVEAQGTLDYHREARDLARWIAARRMNAELYLATSDKSTPELALIEEMKRDGVGLFVIDTHGNITTAHPAVNPALLVTPEPALRYGDCKAEVGAALDKFNQVNRKDGMRDLCELVERETERLAVAASSKGLVTAPVSAIEALDWSSQINLLASPNACPPGQPPVITPQLATDLHSFRDARNLVDHKVRSKAEDTRRQLQFADKMMQGTRLIATIVSIRRKVEA